MGPLGLFRFIFQTPSQADMTPRQAFFTWAPEMRVDVRPIINPWIGVQQQALPMSSVCSLGMLDLCQPCCPLVVPPKAFNGVSELGADDKVCLPN